MSFLQRNEYLLTEIDHYHNQIRNRLTDDAWSSNYRAIWDAICHRLTWYGYGEDGGGRLKIVERLLPQSRYGKVWPMDSPVLSGDLSLAIDDVLLVKTLFDFQLYTGVNGSWETLAHGVHQLPETLIILRLLPYIESFVDVGTDTGYYAFLAAQHGIPVTAVEPSPRAFARLKKGAETNGFTNVAAVPCSVGETAGGTMLYLDRGGVVRTFALNDYRAGGSLVRIAAPGSELQLIRGAAEWLAAYDAPVILVEARPGLPLAPKNHHLAVIGELEKNDYSVFAVSARIRHDGKLLSQVRTGMSFKPALSYLALPPMAKDLAEQLFRPVDMRVFTHTAKLENLHYFVKASFEGL